MPTCANCKAEVPKVGTDPHGNPICCAACLFNPLGCRCKYGELGVLETQQYFSDDDDDDFDEGREPEPCAYCRGSGQYDDATPCPWCDGDGTEPW